jgi:hypothetical protein
VSGVNADAKDRLVVLLFEDNYIAKAMSDNKLGKGLPVKKICSLRSLDFFCKFATNQDMPQGRNAWAFQEVETVNALQQGAFHNWQH